MQDVDGLAGDPHFVGKGTYTKESAVNGFAAKVRDLKSVATRTVRRRQAGRASVGQAVEAGTPIQVIGVANGWATVRVYDRGVFRGGYIPAADVVLVSALPPSAVQRFAEANGHMAADDPELYKLLLSIPLLTPESREDLVKSYLDDSLKLVLSTALFGAGGAAELSDTLLKNAKDAPMEAVKQNAAKFAVRFAVQEAKRATAKEIPAELQDLMDSTFGLRDIKSEVFSLDMLLGSVAPHSDLGGVLEGAPLLDPPVPVAKQCPVSPSKPTGLLGGLSVSRRKYVAFRN